MVIIEFSKLLFLALLFSGCLSSASGSVISSISSTNSIDSHHRKLRRCVDIYTFSNDDIEDLSSSDTSYYMDECIDCEDMNANLQNSAKSWFYSKCIDCSDARDMSSSHFNNLESTVEGWYETKCGNDIFSNQRSGLDCDDIFEINNRDFDILSYSERRFYEEDCVDCDMSSNERRDIDSDSIISWFEEKCDGSTDNNSGNDNDNDSDSDKVLRCSDLLTMRDYEVDDLSTSISDAYINSCVTCEKYDNWSNSEQGNLRDRVTDWYDHEGCIFTTGRANGDLRCFTLFDLTSYRIDNLSWSDRNWYKPECIKCSAYEDYSSSQIDDLNSRLTEWYEDKGCTVTTSSDELRCSTLFDLSRSEIDSLKLSDKIYYQINCIHCDEYDDYSNSEIDDLNSRLIEWYEDGGCISSSSSDTLRCSTLFELSSYQLDRLGYSDKIWYQANCIKCYDYDNYSSSRIDDLESQIISWYDDENCIDGGDDYEPRPYNAFTARTANGCDGCVEDANTFSNCVNDYCISDKEECFGTFEDMADLADCCDMSYTCKRRAEDVEDCFDDCLPECVEDTANNYLECMYYRSGSSSCNREDCFSRIVVDRDWVDDDTIDISNNFFENLGDRLDEIREYSTDINSCDGAEDKAEEVCDINNKCCPDCDGELSDAMDCVVNKVMRPILGVINGGDCETSCRRLLNRRLQNMQVNPPNTASPITTTAAAITTTVPAILMTTEAAESELSTDLEQNTNDNNNDGDVVTVMVETATNENGETVTTTTKTTSVTKTTTTNIVEVYTTRETGDGDNITTDMDPIITSTVVSTTTTAVEIETPTSSGTMEINDDDVVVITDGLVDFGDEFISTKNMTAIEDLPSLAKECKSQLTGGLALGNTTQSSSRFLNCLIQTGTASMADAATVENGESPPSLATSTKNTAKVVILVVASLSILLTWP